MQTLLIVVRPELPLERVYELIGDLLVLASNRRIHIRVEPSMTPEGVVEKYERETWPTLTGPITVRRVEALTGQYFPSIAKPVYPDTNNLILPNSDDELELAKSVWREVDFISDDLEQCFNVNSVSEENFDAYGIQYERIIYFCCIGVESLFRKVFTANRVGRRATMNDYFALNQIARLNEFGLSLVRYPWIPELFPFGEWSSAAPSESLFWFAAYNALKHDKKANAKRASMKNAIFSLAAYYCVAYVTLGKNLFPGFLSTNYYFHFTSKPKWRVEELYFAPQDGIWRSSPLPLGR